VDIMTHRVLILGGTTDARQLAERLAGRVEFTVTLSLAGRTANPIGHPVPVRSGGFGGVEGLVNYLKEQEISLLVDATHPYAARISANAAQAAEQAGVKIFALRRPPWPRQPYDRWTLVADAEAAVAALGNHARNVFLALGRQELAPFEAAPQHSYLIRSVDPVEPPLAVPDATYVLARGPFAVEAEKALLVDNRIDAIVAKNSGGTATYGKIAAARALGVEVILFRRPALPEVTATGTAEATIAAIDHWLASERGV
jgi:precorrin-6A/cobalt-precorrin-6A reductase